MSTVWEKKDEEEAQVQIWKYIFGFAELAAVKCAIELGVADAIENHGSPMTLSEISSALGCDPSLLNRILRFLTSKKIFKAVEVTRNGCSNGTGYAETPLSRLLTRNGHHSMAAFVLMETSPVMLSPWHSLSARVLANGTPPPFVNAHGEDLWCYVAANPEHNNLFNEAMSCDAEQLVPAIVQRCGEAFDGITSLVDIGGGNGNAMRVVAKSCPWIQPISYDLPHVIAAATKFHEVQYVAGDMFQSVPKADAVFLKWILHEWGDKECIQILKNCKEAMPKEKGRVILVEAVIEEGKHEGLNEIGLMLDMVMMAHTNAGKERTFKEWEYLIKTAGFNTCTIKPISAGRSLIMAFC